MTGFKWTSEILRLNQDLDLGGVESKNTIKENVPIALWTRSKDQLQHQTKAMKNNDFLDIIHIEAEWKELLLQSIPQNHRVGRRASRFGDSAKMSSSLILSFFGGVLVSGRLSQKVYEFCSWELGEVGPLLVVSVFALSWIRFHHNSLHNSLSGQIRFLKLESQFLPFCLLLIIIHYFISALGWPKTAQSVL